MPQALSLRLYIFIIYYIYYYILTDTFKLCFSRSYQVKNGQKKEEVVEYPVNLLSGEQEERADVSDESDGSDDEDEKSFEDVAEAVVRKFAAHAVGGEVAARSRTGSREKTKIHKWALI